MQEGGKELGESGCRQEPPGVRGLALEDWSSETQSWGPPCCRALADSIHLPGPLLLCELRMSPGGQN